MRLTSCMALALMVTASSVRAEDEDAEEPKEATAKKAPPPGPSYTLDVRGATYAQVFQRNLAPGAPGAVLESERLASFYGYAFLGLRGVDLPWGKDALNAELSVWGSLGLLPNPGAPNADGDIVSAWVQGVQGPFRIKLGRQVTLPGAARYVRFDGGDVALRLGPVELSAYGGLTVLPRWNRPRGYYVLGSMADALKDPALAEATLREGMWLVGGRVGFVVNNAFRGSVAFHEQHELIKGTRESAVAFRNLAADAIFTGVRNLTLGGRFVFDLSARAPAEARAYADLGFISRLPLSIDYTYQAPALLLPASSIFAAFGSEPWHELGAELTWRASPMLRLVVRGAAQMYVWRPGFRGTARAILSPIPSNPRLTVIVEYTRVGADINGYHHVRAAGRLAGPVLGVSLDGGLYFYDTAVRGVPISAMVFASLEHTVIPQLRFMLSGSLARTPFADFDAQLLGRAVFELDPPSAGGAL